MERTLELDARARGGAEARLQADRLGELFDAHQARLYRLARRLSGDPEEARDLVQETFLRAARRRSSLPGSIEAGEPWLVRTLVNLCRDRGRRLRVRARHADVAPRPSAAPDPESSAVARAEVSHALSGLSPRRRAVVVLRDLEDRSVDEIAELLGVARVTVRWHLAAARRELRERLLGGEND